MNRDRRFNQIQQELDNLRYDANGEYIGDVNATLICELEIELESLRKQLEEIR
jgi:hypothetical protein